MLLGPTRQVTGGAVVPVPDEVLGEITTLKPAIAMPGDPIAALGPESGEHGRLAHDLTRTLSEIRGLRGHERFGMPPSADELRAEAAEGPIVTFAVGPFGGGALLLTTSGVAHIRLPGLTGDAVSARVTAFHDALHAVSHGGEDALRTARRTLTATLEWLWDTATAPVLGTLGYQARPAQGSTWPRLWWIPGGQLGLLPVHAAGYHEQQPGPGEAAASVLDSVISSYAPTVRALRYARKQARHRNGPGRALLVAMPTTPGEEKLPAADAEIKALSGMLPAPVVLAGPDIVAGNVILGNLPTRDNVLRYLPECTIVHFACHAASDATDPSRSLLLLRDYEQSPLTVAALAPVDHECLELAYLSACSTALTAATNLADEAIHLTSAFLLAGSRHVIGTLWPLNDQGALYAATKFYAGLRAADGTRNTDYAASALHRTVRAMRERWREAPWLWASYLHAGA